MFKKMQSTLSAMALLALVACGGGGGDGGAGSGVNATGAGTSGYPQAPASCEVAGQRAWLRDYMNDQYFWFDQQGAPNAAASSMAEYLSSLTFKPTDRYSFAQNTAQFTQFFAEGRRTGYGYSLAYADAAQTVLKLRLVEPLSPVATAGLQRGDTVVAIDGLTPSQITSGSLTAVSTAGVARNFLVTKPNGATLSFSVNSADFALSPVLASNVMTAPNNAKVGYLAYQEFIGSSNAALGNAINSFRAGGVSEVVLDLRYNGGGSTSVARNLASLLGGSELDGKLFAQYRYNSKNTANNFNQTFTASTSVLPATPLNGLSRVFVITSPNTASASELVFNSLKPFKGIVTIGSTSFGKPYAFQPREACGTTYNAVNLEIVNANGAAVSTSGVPATCAVSDDLTRQLGDPAELRTAAALGYISTGVCPPAAVAGQDIVAKSLSDSAQTATKSIAKVPYENATLGEDGKPLPVPRGARVD